MAEALLRENGITSVKSAGLFAARGEPMSEGTKTALESVGVSFETKATQIDADIVSWADLILTMTKSHAVELTRQFQHANGKTYTLSQYTTGEDHIDIMDPYGQHQTAYQRTLIEMQDYINKLIKKLENKDN